jgi:hypothetical protein
MIYDDFSSSRSPSRDETRGEELAHASETGLSTLQRIAVAGSLSAATGMALMGSVAVRGR